MLPSIPTPDAGQLTVHANQLALERMFAVRPMWTGVVTAGSALQMGERTVLHAGPPLLDATRPPAPLRSAMVLSCLYEGWASSEAAADRLIDDGGLTVLPAQNFSCVTPLAAVITPTSSLVEVVDASGIASPAWSLLSSGPPPDIRFGTRDHACLDSMAYRDGALKSVLQAALTRSVDLFAMARLGLAGGDELHSRTHAATTALRDELLLRLAERADLGGAAAALSAMLSASSGFFLTLWMAACRLCLSACEGIAHCSLVTRIGANGESVGLSLADHPGRWWTAPAAPPVGGRLPHLSRQLAAAGVVGDSAVVDAMGFGGQLTRNSPEVRESLKLYLPVDFYERDAHIMLAGHPAFAGQCQVRSGLDAMRVESSGLQPLVNIGILAADGRSGLLGRGLYMPPVELFCRAITRN